MLYLLDHEQTKYCSSYLDACISDICCPIEWKLKGMIEQTWFYVVSY